MREKIEQKIKKIASSYHDREVLSGLLMKGQICDCCKKNVSSTISIEHDSRDYSKDLNVCDSCYDDLLNYWKNNKPNKISPI